ncbi:MAG: ABC transporter permease [Saprospiraceae bacterium]|nr:ABC transporter permease [Saprospiraceae bacterium]
MLQNYIKTAFRNLLKNRTFSLINIIGLAVSISVCLLIIMLIQDAYRYDQFHPNGDRVYRVITDAQRTNGDVESYASSPYLIGKTLTDNYRFAEAWIPLCRGLNGEATAEGKQLAVSGLFTDANFFKLFGYKLQSGDPANAFAKPFTIVLTAETAQRFFGTTDPIGKTIEFPEIGLFEITGVLQEPPGKSHLEFEALASFTTVPSLERQENPRLNVTENWPNYYSNYNYFLLKDGVNPSEVENALNAISKEHYADLDLETRDAGYRFRLQALGKITPGPNFSNNMGRALPAFLLWFLSALGGVIILLASFNYTNLTVAHSLKRTKEIGVRKVMGASRGHVAWQFLGEAIFTALLSLGIGFLLLQLIIPGFNQLEFTRFSDITLKIDASTVAWFVAFALTVGLLAGTLPAVLLSKTRPQVILQKLESFKPFRRLGLQKSLIVIQFTVSLLFLICITVNYQQMRYIFNMDYGFNQELLVNVELQGQDYQTVATEMSNIAGVERVSGVSHNMGTWEDGSVDVRKNVEEEPVIVRDYTIDHQFIPNLELKIIAGENFPNNPTQQHELFAVVNEKFVEQFKLGTPMDALGKTIIIGDSTTLAIHGVLKDFLFKPANYALEPLLLRYDPTNLRLLNIKVNSSDVTSTLAAMERTWDKIDPAHEFTYEFYEDTIRENYANMQDILWIVGFITFLSFTIAALGLLGIATYAVATRTKEVSIRKVFGANWSNLAVLLSKEFMLLLVIATVLAVPAGYVLGNLMLQTFAFRISMNAWLFLPGVLGMLLLGALMIGSQVMRAVVANPAESLRNE